MGMEKELKEKFPLGGWRAGSNGVFSPALQEGRIPKEKFLFQFLAIPESFSCLARNLSSLSGSSPLLSSLHAPPLPAACPPSPTPCQLAKGLGQPAVRQSPPWS